MLINAGRTCERLAAGLQNKTLRSHAIVASERTLFLSSKPPLAHFHVRVRVLGGQVFWLPDRPSGRAFPSPLAGGSGFAAAFVTGYSGGTAPVSHRLPY